MVKLSLMGIVALMFLSVNAHATTECIESINSYFVGTTEINQNVAHLWVNFEGGGSASVESESAAFNAILSTVITSITTNKRVKVRYLEDNVSCEEHRSDWVGLYLIR